MAAPNLALALPVPQAHGACTFAQLYDDASKDPFKRNYERIMERFDPDRNDAVRDDVLFQQAVSLGGTTLRAYLCCGITLNVPKIYCVHLPTKFVAAMDGTTTPWDDRSFAFLGDIVRGLITTIMFLDDAFDEITIRTRTIDYMVQHQEELTDAPFFPMATPQDDQSEEITTRKLMFLPAVYVPLLINSRGYTAKEVWASLYPAILQRQELNTCAPLLKWLQVASTGAVRLPALIGDPVTSIRLISPPADEVLLAHRHELLHQVLPALSAPPQSLETALSHMATALINQTNDQRQAREQRFVDEQEPKLPSTRFTVTLPVLMEYLQVDDERNLPEIWHSWSNCTKRQELQVLRDTLDAFPRTPAAYSTTVPLVTARLTQDMLNFNFVGHSADDLSGGLHPFIIADSNTEQRQSNLEVARLYGLLTSGEAMCSLADLETLQAKDV
jgi:hypothetical protein